MRVMPAARVGAATVVLALALVGGGSAASSATPRHSAASGRRWQHPSSTVTHSWSPGNPMLPGLPRIPMPPMLPGAPVRPFVPGTQMPLMPGVSPQYLNGGCTGKPFRDSLTAPPILVQTCFIAP
jgi:hypothetical protein